jgi:hypothetical protein
MNFCKIKTFTVIFKEIENTLELFSPKLEAAYAADNGARAPTGLLLLMQAPEFTDGKGPHVRQFNKKVGF